MKGYNMNGDWSDVTNHARNQLVFEGRHKAYGAYYVRRRYNNALWLALLVSISIVTLSAGIPFIINLVSAHKLFATPPGIIAKPKEYVMPIDNREKPKPIDKAKQPKQTKQPQDKSANVAVTLNPTDTAHTARDLAHVNIGITNKPGKPADSANIVRKPDNGTENKQQEPFKWVKNMPQFPGDINTYIANHIKYPVQAVEMQKEGMVYASFVVEADGSVSTVKLLRGIAGAPELDDEALRVLQSMPNWTPGSQNNHPVRVQYNIPIKFQLK